MPTLWYPWSSLQGDRPLGGEWSHRKRGDRRKGGRAGGTWAEVGASGEGFFAGDPLLETALVSRDSPSRLGKGSAIPD